MTIRKTPKTNTEKCLEMEYLTVKIYKHHSQAFVYNVWAYNKLLGQIVEDDIMFLFGKGEMQRLNNKEKVFRVSVKKLKKAITRPNYIN